MHLCHFIYKEIVVAVNYCRYIIFVIMLCYVMLFYIKRNCCRRRLPAGPKGPLAICGGTAILT